VGVLVLGAWGCKRESAAPPPPPPPEVSVMVVEPRTVPLRYEYVGLTEPSQTVEIRSRVQGFLFKRAFEEGGKIKAGDLLFQIDPRSFEADLEIALSRVEQAQAIHERTRRDLDRYKELSAKGAATQKELDDAVTAETEARASLRLARADASKAELDLSYTSILSPFDGVIGKSFRDVGSLVDTGPNSLLANAMQMDPIYISFSISERDVLQWKTDLAARRIVLPGDQQIRVGLILVDGSRYDKEGKINFVDVKTDPSTGSAHLRAEVANSEGRLQPGQFVRAELIGAERPDALTIPQRCVVQTPNGAIVFLVGEGDKAEIRPLKLGPWAGDKWIVEEGLKAGERVIVDGIARVQPGSPVKPTPYIDPGQAGGAAAQTAVDLAGGRKDGAAEPGSTEKK
jgi:membrane fusion protein (multidrug efflux system)